MSDDQESEETTPKFVTDDESSLVEYDIRVRSMNSRLSPAQRKALYRFMARQAQQLSAAMALLLQDDKVVQISVVRKSSNSGTVVM